MRHQGVMRTMGLECRSAWAHFCFSGLLSGRRRGDQRPQETEDGPQDRCQGRTSRRLKHSYLLLHKNFDAGRDSPGKCAVALCFTSPASLPRVPPHITGSHGPQLDKPATEGTNAAGQSVHGAWWQLPPPAPGKRVKRLQWVTVLRSR